MLTGEGIMLYSALVDKAEKKPLIWFLIVAGFTAVVGLGWYLKQINEKIESTIDKIGDI
jgi:hypothetical protein